jgi:hypothetical protein
MRSTRRDAKKANRVRRDADRLARRGQHLVDLLRRLGFTDPSAALVRALVDRRYPEPDVVLSARASSRSSAREVGAAVRTALADSTVALAPHDTCVPVSRFFADYLMIADACSAELHELGDAGPAWSEFARTIAPHQEENIKRAAFAVAFNVDDALLPYCDLSADIYFAKYDFVKSSARATRKRMTVVVDVHRAEPTTFMRDSVRRPAWRCGLPFRECGIEWVRWPRGTLGLEGDLSDAEVYVQSHALQRLRERLCFEPSALTDWVWQSLRKPRLLPQRGGWLVEFRVAQWHLGYLCAEEVEGKILVTTFLFLTNAGTPEGRRLRERTKFRTDQISWLNMDHLSYFLQSDVQNDPDLRALFTECGCGHLFEMMKPEARVATLRMAAATRRHLGMQPPADDTASSSPSRAS